MNKKAEIPYWLAMMIFVLASLVVILLIIALVSGKMQEFLGWLESMF